LITTRQARIEELPDEGGFFGEAVCQIFGTYIISEAEDKLFLIDLHAVHEKITMQRIRAELSDKNVQYLLKPAVIELRPDQLEQLMAVEDSLTASGYKFQVVQSSAIVEAIPGLLSEDQARDLLDKILETREAENPIEFIRAWVADMACHNSIRSGRRLSLFEMNDLLRQMERTPTIHQCNHHRPAYLTIEKHELHKLFDRR
jgi:DNA mismatch repair protein MutL